jgi:hypothetical protein
VTRLKGRAVAEAEKRFKKVTDAGYCRPAWAKARAKLPGALCRRTLASLLSATRKRVLPPGQIDDTLKEHRGIRLSPPLSAELSLCRPSNRPGLQTLPCRWHPYRIFDFLWPRALPGSLRSGMGGGASVKAAALLIRRDGSMTPFHDDAEFFDAVPEAAACLRPLRAHECNGATPGSRLVLVSRAAGGGFLKETTSWPPVGTQRIPINQADAASSEF